MTPLLSDAATCLTCRVLITAGPTHEPIDDVRYIGNRSSGRMGIALAEAAAAVQWPATLLLGPGIPAPDNPHLTVHRFRTTDDLQRLLNQHWPDHDLLIMAAAVADYRPVTPAGGKLRRTADAMTIQLEPTPDLLAALAPSTRVDQYTIGFALEPREQLDISAMAKLQRKFLDAIVANPLETMESPDVEATVYFADGTTRAPETTLPKSAFARWLIAEVAPRLSRSAPG